MSHDEWVTAVRAWLGAVELLANGDGLLWWAQADALAGVLFEGGEAFAVWPGVEDSSTS
jgi:hypothetical protein